MMKPALIFASGFLTALLLVSIRYSSLVPKALLFAPSGQLACELTHCDGPDMLRAQTTVAMTRVASEQARAPSRPDFANREFWDKLEGAKKPEIESIIKEMLRTQEDIYKVKSRDELLIDALGQAIDKDVRSNPNTFAVLQASRRKADEAILQLAMESSAPVPVATPLPSPTPAVRK